MHVDGIHVDQEYASDTQLVFSFAVDDDTFFRVILCEGGNNLRVYRCAPGDLEFHPVRWLLPKDPDRRPLNETGPDVEGPIAAFVRDCIAAAGGLR